jgi:hypothetical protein
LLGKLPSMTTSIPITTSSMWSQVPPRPDLSTEPVLHIESPAVVQAACDLATLLDAPVEEAIAFALHAQLRRERALQPSPEQRLRAIHAFVSSLAELPIAEERERDVVPRDAD